MSSGGTVYGLPESSYLAEDHPTNPISSYGITKLAIEKYLFLYERLHGLKSIALRLSNPYGPGQRLSGAQGAVAVFLGAALRGEAIKIWGAGEVVRDYVYVDDVVDAVLGTIEYAGESRVFNIGSGVGLDLIEVVEAIERAVKTTMTKEFLPARGFDVPRNVLDISLAKNELNWVPQVDFDSGVERMAVWAKELLTNSHGDQN